MKYKITAKKTGMGWQLILWKRYWFFYLPDTIETTRYGYEYMVDETINEWVDNLNIPEENVTIKK